MLCESFLMCGRASTALEFCLSQACIVPLSVTSKMQTVGTCHIGWCFKTSFVPALTGLVLQSNLLVQCGSASCAICAVQELGWIIFGRIWQGTQRIK